MKIKENVSVVFLLPGVEIKSEIKNQFYSHGFRNTFLTCPPLTYPFEVIYLLFRPEVIDADFMSFAEELQKNPNFIEVIDGGKGKVLFVYRIPKRFRRDYELFLEGKYSKFSGDFRKCFQMEQFKLDINGRPIKEAGRYVKEFTNFHHIFNRTDHIKDVWKERLGYKQDEHILDDMELYDRQDSVKETLEEELWLG